MRAQLSQPELSGPIAAGQKIAVAVGSRGIRNLPLMVRELVDFLKSRKAKPFIFPAMGSHGGASTEGQRALLDFLGITEEAMGCPIVSSLEVKEIGRSEDGRPVMLDRHAAEADGLIAVCRVKPHTAFRAPFESGIMKMLAVGVSKQAGAELVHGDGVEHLARNVQLFGRAMLRQAKFLSAVAVVENAFDETCRLEIVPASRVEEREPLLLREAFANMPRLWVASCDVLAVDEIGKNYSGDGMTPNITGTFCVPGVEGGISAQKVTVLALSKETNGQGTGIGECDAIPQALFEQLNLDALYMNAITSTVLTCGRIPMIMANHRECLQVCLRSCVGHDRNRPRLVRIPNSLHLEHIWLSEAYLAEAEAHEHLIVESGLEHLAFDEAGNLF
jgi:hypothetical protein